MWRHWIRWIHDWSREMTEDDAKRVGLRQAEMLEEAAKAIREAVAEREALGG